MKTNKWLVGCLAGLLLYVQMGDGSLGHQVAQAAKAKTKVEQKESKYFASVLPADIPKDEKYILGLYYGNGENILIRENGGRMEMLYKTLRADSSFAKANVFPMTKVHFDSYTIQEAGPMYSSEAEVKFMRDSDGYGITCRVGGHTYSRAFLGQSEGERAEAYRVPEHSEEEWQALRKESLDAVMPATLTSERVAGLKQLSGLEYVKIDSVYATADNLFGAPLYDTPSLYLGEQAAQALQSAANDLAKFGYGVVVWDAYRPWHVSKLAHLALPEGSKGMLEDPDTSGSSHNTGMAVDVGLYDLATGETMDLGSGFDEPSPRQYASYAGGTSRQRMARQLLRMHMQLHGFAGIEMEWWHFEYKPEGKWSMQNVDAK